MVSLKRSSFWKGEYTETNIIEWFKNFITFYPDPSKVSLETAKKEFLEGELDFINTIFNKKDSEKIYNLVKSVIDNIEEV